MRPGPQGTICPAGMRQRGPASLGTLFTRPTETAWKFQEGHREDSNLEQNALFLSPFLPFPLTRGRGRLGEESKHPRWAESQEDQCGEMGVQGRAGRDPDEPGEVDFTWERATGRAKSRG